MKTYDLQEEGHRVRAQMKTVPDPIAEARHIMSQTILGHVLLALSDTGFFEYVAGRTSFSIAEAVSTLKLNEFTFRSLVEYLTGCGALTMAHIEADHVQLTGKGERYFNVYTRGVVNVYLGGYSAVLQKLGGLLDGSLHLHDKALARSTRHAAAGTAYSTCTFTIPDVFAAMDDKQAKVCLDLGCGTGDFLIQYALRNPEARGIGVDMSPDALRQARENAKAFGVADRVAFHEAAIGPGPLKVPSGTLDEVDMVTSMYMLHEFGRDGRQAIVDVVAALKRQLPGRKLLALEVEACDPVAFATQKPPAAHYGRLDYRLIHQLSAQGLPREPESWHQIFADAGCRMVESGIPTGGSLIYIAEM